MSRKCPPRPVHIAGTQKGEEFARKKGKEPGRQEKGQGGYRAARDSTGIRSDHHGPIDPAMPNIPPA